MALAWKAGSVQALAGSNPASSATRMGIKPDTVRKRINRALRIAQNRAAEVMRELENALGCSKLSALAVRWAAWPDRCSGRSLLVPWCCTGRIESACPKWIRRPLPARRVGDTLPFGAWLGFR